MFRYGGWLVMLFYRLFGMRVLLLTTTGRKSGLPRTTPAMFVKKGQDLYIAAISPTAQRFPNWYHNLTANPIATVEIFWIRRRYQGELVSDSGLKLDLLKQFPFGLIEAAQDRPAEEIPVFRLVRQHR